jgi:ribosomal protein L11 methyltransferase
VTDWQLIIDWRALGAAHRELLIGELWCHTIYGIEERDDVAVVGFATEVAARAAAAAIVDSSGVSVTIVELLEDTYLDEWRGFARPWRVSGLFVRPSWVDAVAPPGTIEIVIDPQRSFGSGAHASTRLTLELMQSLDFSGCTVLDVGCGSGVLSVAAAVLGAARVDAIDIETEAVAATAANALCNGVDDRIHARVATVGSVGEQFDTGR